MTRPFDCVVLDFDGTFTDVDREGAPFLEGYRRDLLAELGQGADVWNTAEATVLRNPENHGWEFGGHIVAPSTADPYIRATSIAQILLREAAYPEAKRGPLLEQLYRSNYAKSENVFRPDAKSTIEALVDSGLAVFFVTNSHTVAVEGKLAALAPRGLDRVTVFGDAKKYVVAPPAESDARFTALPATKMVDGLTRPVLLHRGPYFDVLRRVWAAAASGPERTVLCGDIYELDLAMPAELGVATSLVSRGSTAGYEKAATLASPRGVVASELGQILERIEAA